MDTNTEHDVIEGDDEFEIEVVDDAPPESEPEDKADGLPDEDEAKQYSQNVQKRIKELTKLRYDEKRAAEAAARERDEAVAFARRQHEELTALRGKLTEGETVLATQAEQRIEAQLAQAQRDLRAAYDEGDTDAMAKAQMRLSSLASEKARVDEWKSRQSSKPKDEPRPARDINQPQDAPRQQPKIRKPSEKAQQWAENNPWFNANRRMTAYAYGVHEELINSGVEPDTDEYYRQIDKEMRKVFPNEFDDDEQANPSPVVAAPSRKAGKKPRKVTLTETQVRFAKRLGLTHEEYARQILKEQGNG